MTIIRLEIERLPYVEACQMKIFAKEEFVRARIIIIISSHASIGRISRLSRVRLDRVQWFNKSAKLCKKHSNKWELSTWSL